MSNPLNNFKDISEKIHNGDKIEVFHTCDQMPGFIIGGNLSWTPCAGSVSIEYDISWKDGTKSTVTPREITIIGGRESRIIDSNQLNPIESSDGFSNSDQ